MTRWILWAILLFVVTSALGFGGFGAVVALGLVIYGNLTRLTTENDSRLDSIRNRTYDPTLSKDSGNTSLRQKQMIEESYSGAGKNVSAPGQQASDPVYELAVALWRNASVKQVERIIASGVNVNTKLLEDGTSVLTFAIMMADPPNPTVITKLIKFGADVNARDHSGSTPLMAAAVKPTFLPGQTEPEQVVKILLEAGADTHARTNGNSTAFTMAAGFNHNPRIIDLLSEAGAISNRRQTDGVKALMMAASLNPSPKVIESILNAGVDVDARAEDGSTAAMKAAASNPNPKVLEILLDEGADISLQDSNGKKAVDYFRENLEVRHKPEYPQLEARLQATDGAI